MYKMSFSITQKLSKNVYLSWVSCDLDLGKITSSPKLRSKGRENGQPKWRMSIKNFTKTQNISKVNHLRCCFLLKK